MGETDAGLGVHGAENADAVRRRHRPARAGDVCAHARSFTPRRSSRSRSRSRWARWTRTPGSRRSARRSRRRSSSSSASRIEQLLAIGQRPGCLPGRDQAPEGALPGPRDDQEVRRARPGAGGQARGAREDARGSRTRLSRRTRPPRRLRTEDREDPGEESEGSQDRGRTYGAGRQGRTDGRHLPREEALPEAARRGEAPQTGAEVPARHREAREAALPDRVARVPAKRRGRHRQQADRASTSR